MNKAILFYFVIALFALNLNALDITTTDGKVYKDAKVTNILPDAIGFMYTKKDGTPVIRDVEMTSLTENLQKKFKYSPNRATKFKKQVAKFQSDRAKVFHKQHKEDLALFKKHLAMSKEIDQIKAMLRAHRIQCWAHIMRSIGEDCVAKIARPYSTSKFGHLGQMYIRNLTGPQNTKIGTVIYPTGKTISLQEGNFPVYDANLDKCALRILKARENSTTSTAPAKTMVFPENAPRRKKK